MADPVSGPRQSLRDRIAEREWYHTLELDGIETPGWFDLRGVVDRVGFPADLRGQRCLDVATFDGFWAFEMERRGAAEVIAIDLLDPAQWDWPRAAPSDAIEAIGSRKGRGEGFEIAAGVLGSRVRRLEMSVYDVDPDELGQFDFVYLGSLLLHLRDPVRALERLSTICRGRLLVLDAVDLRLTALHPRKPVASLDGLGRPWWWKPNVAGLVRMVEAAGFRVQGTPRRVYMPGGAGYARPALNRETIKRPSVWPRLVAARRGDPHAAVMAEPVRSAGRAQPGERD